MGLVRAVCACDHPGCDNRVDLRVSPASKGEALELLEVARAIAEQRGWKCQIPGEPRELNLEPLPGYDDPTIDVYAEGRDLCPEHAI